MQERKNLCVNYLSMFEMDLNGIWHAVETCWCDQSHSHTYFILSDQSSNQLIKLRLVFHLKTVTLACIQTFTHQFLSNLA